MVLLRFDGVARRKVDRKRLKELEKLVWCSENKFFNNTSIRTLSKIIISIFIFNKTSLRFCEDAFTIRLL